MDKPRAVPCFWPAAAAALLALTAAGCGEQPQQGAPTPAGYWEGSVSSSETPMKDAVRTLTRTAKAEFWFTVEWDKVRGSGIVAGEAEAVYDAVLKVDHLPTVSAPTPGGGTIKFEPQVGGKLTETDNRRKFAIVGVLLLDPKSGKGTLLLQKFDAKPSGSKSEQMDKEAKGEKPFNAPMEFTIRADPGVSGGFSGAAGSVKYADGKVSGQAGAGGIESREAGADVGKVGNVILQKIPMTPFSPFSDAPGIVEKRPGGPYTASFEEKGDKHIIRWSAKQMGGEQREPLRITPEMRQQAEKMIKDLGGASLIAR